MTHANRFSPRMVGETSVAFILVAASVNAVINPVVVPATLGTSITRQVDANTQMIFEYTVRQLTSCFQINDIHSKTYRL